MISLVLFITVIVVPSTIAYKLGKKEGKIIQKREGISMNTLSEIQAKGGDFLSSEAYEEVTSKL